MWSMLPPAELDQILAEGAWQWPGGLPEASARLGRPVAELADAGRPERVVTVKGFKGVVILPPGEPMYVDNVWLTYPGRRHAVTARGNTLLCDHDRNPASAFSEWLFAAVDPTECRHPDGMVKPPEDQTPLLVNGGEIGPTCHYQTAGLHFRAIRMGYEGYFVAVCPVGQEDQTRLVSQ